MHDIKWIRANPERFSAAMARRGVDVHGLASLDAHWRSCTGKVQELNSFRNSLSGQIGALMKAGDRAKADELKIQVAGLKEQLEEAEDAERDATRLLNNYLLSLPNMAAEDVPDGTDETANVEVKRWGEPRTDQPAHHYDLGHKLGPLMDFETAAKVSGSRFVFLKGELARLERILGAFMLDMHTDNHGYTEVSPPLMVNTDSMRGTGQLPKFADDLYNTTDDHWLIPTAEVSVTNMLRDSIVEEADLGRFAALTPCFRAEAGSAGRDTRGLIRQHQFYKVELVSFTTAEKAEEELERTIRCVEAVLINLQLPFRVVKLCAGDMGFSAEKTYDFEVWMPAQQTYREISSVSYFGAFQGRRMNARYHPAGEKAVRPVHTINGSGVAVGRAMAALLETYQEDTGSVLLPLSLRPYFLSPRIGE